MGNRNYDRYERNETDGMEFYGYDDKESGKTDWYTKDGILDSRTDTPNDDENDW